jgi:hypothetical protein
MSQAVAIVGAIEGFLWSRASVVPECAANASKACQITPVRCEWEGRHLRYRISQDHRRLASSEAVGYDFVGRVGRGARDRK